MPILRNAMIAAMVSGAVIAAPSAALAATGTAPAAHAAVISNAAIRKVACKSSTFNVTHGRNARTCYEGTGVTRPEISDVHTITTGRNTGIFCVQIGTARDCIAFLPHRSYSFHTPQAVKLTYLDITHA